MSKSCRICDSVLSRTHYVALFSRESLASDLANRLSKVADVPVASEDGLSRFICIPCKNKLICQESIFRTTAKATYEKNKDPLSLPLVVIHKSRLQIRELRIQVVLGHLLRLGSVDQGLSG